MAKTYGEYVKIYTFPEDEAVLRTKSQPVTKFDASLFQLASTLIGAMFTSKGIGISAPQIGVHKQVIVVLKDGIPVVMVNPELVAKSENITELKEGCLSFPDVAYSVLRPNEVTVKFVTPTGVQQKLSLSGIEAKCVQHEIDHLHGILIEDLKQGDDNV